MNHSGWVICIIIVFLAFCSTNKNESYLGNRHVCVSDDQRCYAVVDKFTTTNEASHMLSYLNGFIIRFMKYLRQKYMWNKMGSAQQQQAVRLIFENYSPDILIENSPATSKNTSYVENKNQLLALCLRHHHNLKNGDMLPKHMLEFVTLHELSHMATKSYGHGEDFWSTFKFLLQEANQANIHVPANYANNPINYCNLRVSYNPFFDTEIRPI